MRRVFARINIHEVKGIVSAGAEHDTDEVEVVVVFIGSFKSDNIS